MNLAGKYEEFEDKLLLALGKQTGKNCPALLSVPVKDASASEGCPGNASCARCPLSVCTLNAAARICSCVRCRGVQQGRDLVWLPPHGFRLVTT